MARIVKKGNNIFYSGKLGPIVLRVKKDMNVIATAPASYKKSKSKKAVAGRNNFASVVGFARCINRIAEIKEILNNSSLPGTDPYHKLIKGNMLNVESGFLSKDNFITPPGQRLSVSEYFIEDNIIHITFDIFGIIRAPLTLYQIIYFYNRRETTNALFRFVNVTTFIDYEQANNIRRKGESKYSIKIKLSQVERKILSMYMDAIVFIAVKGTPMNKYKRFWTSTVSKEIILG